MHGFNISVLVGERLVDNLRLYWFADGRVTDIFGSVLADSPAFDRKAIIEKISPSILARYPEQAVIE